MVHFGRTERCFKMKTTGASVATIKETAGLIRLSFEPIYGGGNSFFFQA
jgi:hypothetical protein